MMYTIRRLLCWLGFHSIREVIGSMKGKDVIIVEKRCRYCPHYTKKETEVDYFK